MKQENSKPNNTPGQMLVDKMRQIFSSLNESTESESKHTKSRAVLNQSDLSRNTKVSSYLNFEFHRENKKACEPKKSSNNGNLSYMDMKTPTDDSIYLLNYQSSTSIRESQGRILDDLALQNNSAHESDNLSKTLISI